MLQNNSYKHISLKITELDWKGILHVDLGLNIRKLSIQLGPA